jgi:ABC-type methionine transport system permease subunit
VSKFAWPSYFVLFQLGGGRIPFTQTFTQKVKAIFLNLRFGFYMCQLGWIASFLNCQILTIFPIFLVLTVKFGFIKSKLIKSLLAQFHHLLLRFPFVFLVLRSHSLQNEMFTFEYLI